MESSKILGLTEECSRTSRNESGWTSYIASPVQENNLDDDDGGGGDGGDESDDSMASDASSGPCNPELPCKSSEGSVNMGPSRYARTTKDPSKEKLNKQVNQRNGAGIRVENEASVVKKANSAGSRVQSQPKVNTTKARSLLL